jgi:methionyl-tRNA synthetase
MLPADAYARYMRARGHEVLLICATDEHGTPAELAAAAAGQPVADYCAGMWAVQKRLGEGFRLSFDYFGRSSSQRNHQFTQHLAGRLADAGLIEEVSERQVYSNADGRFLPDRYIEGTCPECGYSRARGDQCENCTKQLDPTDLIEPHSAISGSTDLEVRETKHLYLKQSAMRGRLTEWIDSKTDWPLLTTSIAKKWLNEGEGLRDRGITRDLDWGIPVKRGTEDWPGMEGKVFYVWFDAPIEYISATAEWADANGLCDGAWQRWWREDLGANDVRYVQFMAKDNVPFHTLSFPVTMLPSDYWRWWLLSNAPEGSDSDFTWAGFQTGVNKDLADVLGNFVSRVTKFCRSKFGETVPEGGEYGAAEAAVTAEITRRLAVYEDHWEAMEFRKAAAELRAIWVAGNEYLQAAAPWAAFKEDPAKAAAPIRFALNLIRLYAILSRPFVPDASDTMLAALGIGEGAGEGAWPEDVEAALATLSVGHGFTVPENLFAKISDDAREEMEARFAGA